MASIDYQLLKRTLDLNVGVDWLREDSKDDFFPDAFIYRDVHQMKSDYLKQREHRMLQIDVIASIMDHVPKPNGMIRESIWLRPIRRILYLGVLHNLLPKLDRVVPPTVYSYRQDQTENPQDYPFRSRSDRWKQFHNDFRAAALEDSTQAVLLTDLASFYDHISIERLCSRIESTFGRSIDEGTRAILSLLEALLNLWSTMGYGIPQNYDPSSFFGSFYLQNVDLEMLGKRYRYFRFVDDIRICARSKDQALRALHDLQNACARDRLFLSSDKTKILEKGSEQFDRLLDVEDDVIISKAEEAIASGDKKRLEETSAILLKKLEFHAGAEGEDRKFRAYANRLLSIGEYKELRERIICKVREFVLPRLRSHPSRSDYWAKMLSVGVNEDVFQEVRHLLIEHRSVFNWQRFHLWKLLTYSETAIPGDLLTEAKSIARNPVSELEAAAAMVCVGRHGTNADREQLFSSLYSAQAPYPIQRALITAIQEMPSRSRQRLWERAVEINSEHRQLVDFLGTLTAPDYGVFRRPEKTCREEPKKVTVFMKAGIGLVRGKRTTFRLSRSHYDYE